MELGNRVKELRKKRGVNQKQLAEASGLTQATISRIESGQVKDPRQDALVRLATALGVTVDFLIGKTDELTPYDVLKSDSTAQYIFRGYEKLSAERRKELVDFLRFLEQDEKKKGGDNE